MLTNSQKNLLMAGVLIIAAGVVGSYFYLTASESSDSQTVTPLQSIQPLSGQTPGLTPQPAGQAPPGKIWSVEHGHWHDVQSSGTTSTVLPTTPPRIPPGQDIPQPPGEAPEGKVWFPEHGHWHDAPSVRIINPNEASPPDSQ